MPAFSERPAVDKDVMRYDEFRHERQRRFATLYACVDRPVSTQRKRRTKTQTRRRKREDANARVNLSCRATTPSHPSLADSGGRRRDGRRLRVWPVSGLTTSRALPSRPDASIFIEVFIGQWRRKTHARRGFAALAKKLSRCRRMKRRWSLTVAGTAQVKRTRARPVSRLTAHANACAGTKRAHTIAHGAPPDKPSRPMPP
nr:hypothetical protein HUO10_005670 [Paraburkholderia busanensis]